MDNGFVRAQRRRFHGSQEQSIRYYIQPLYLMFWILFRAERDGLHYKITKKQPLIYHL